VALGVCVVIYFLAPSLYELTVDKEQLFAPDSATTWREISFWSCSKRIVLSSSLRALLSSLTFDFSDATSSQEWSDLYFPPL
jgi:hypothetical protein